MRNKILLFIFSTIISIIVWNAFDLGGCEGLLLEENLTAELEVEDLLGEEESEDYENHGITYGHIRIGSEFEYTSQRSFRYAFAVLTFSPEPEEYPPCC